MDLDLRSTKLQNNYKKSNTLCLIHNFVIFFCIRTRPVANLEIWLEMDPDPMDPEIQNCALDGKPITCVTVKVCFFYEAVSTPESMGK